MEDSGVRETHVSILLFLGDRVLKFRKPVRFDFVDFTSRQARQEDCRREVALNARLAPDVYLGTADVVLDGGLVDHAVVLRRLPAERALASLVAVAPPDALEGELGAIARTLAAFHHRADRSPAIAAVASAEAVSERFGTEMAVIDQLLDPTFEPAARDAIGALGRRFLAGRGPLFDARIGGGHVCDGHGDLQADDIYCLSDGPRILDCLEFDDRLRYGDVAADVAFLAMDLERLGHPWAAGQFVHDYEAACGERIPGPLLHFYIASRAIVRVKVACLRGGNDPTTARREAAELLALARRHLDRARVRLILVGGLPGSGKTTLARLLGDTLGATVLSSDTLRSTHHGAAAPGAGPSGFRQGRYRRAETGVVYEDLLGRARHLLGMGHTVVLDASWTDESRRHAARLVAGDTAAELAELRCNAPTPRREARMAERARAATDASEATIEISRAMEAHEDPWPHAMAIDTAPSPDDALAQALHLLGITAVVAP